MCFATWVTDTVCGPVAAGGTMIVVPNAPAPFTWTVGIPSVTPSQPTCRRTFGGKLVPVTWTREPGTPL